MRNSRRTPGSIGGWVMIISNALGKSMRRLLLSGSVVAGAAVAAMASPAQAQTKAESKPVRIGLVTFLSGAAAGPFGVPARNSAEVLVEALNGGKAPAPYSGKGLGGSPIELVFIDEAGGTAKQVSEYRDLVQRQ